MMRLVVLLVLVASPALAEVCDKERPDWDGMPVSAIAEAVILFLSPLGLILLACTALAVRYRSQWGGVAITVGWTGFATLVTMADPSGVRALAQAEGCIGPSSLFVALAAAISAGTILYTAPRGAQN